MSYSSHQYYSCMALHLSHQDTTMLQSDSNKRHQTLIKKTRYYICTTDSNKINDSRHCWWLIALSGERKESPRSHSPRSEPEITLNYTSLQPTLAADPSKQARVSWQYHITEGKLSYPVADSAEHRVKEPQLKLIWWNIVGVAIVFLRCIDIVWWVHCG